MLFTKTETNNNPSANGKPAVCLPGSETLCIQIHSMTGTWEILSRPLPNPPYRNDEIKRSRSTSTTTCSIRTITTPCRTSTWGRNWNCMPVIP